MENNRYRVEILTPAQRELDAIAEIYFQLYGPESARKITDRIYHSLERLQSFPLSGKLHPDRLLGREGYRLLICGRYICVYRLIEETVYIYHIVHGSTDYPKLFKDINKDA